VRRSHLILVVVVTAVVAVATTVGGIWAASRPMRSTSVSPTISPPSPVTARIGIGDRPRQLALDDDGLLVVGDRFLHRVELPSGREAARAPVGTSTATPAGLALSRGQAWVPAETSDLLWRVDPAAGRPPGEVRLGQPLYGPVAMAARGDSIWVACCAFKYGRRPAGMLLQVDARRHRVVRRVPVPDGPLAVLADREALWVATADGSVRKLDPGTGRTVLRIPPVSPKSRIQALASGSDGKLWAADTGASSVRRLDPATGRYDLAVPVHIPRNLAVGPGTVWVVRGLNQTLTRVDERTGRVGRRVPATTLGGIRGIVATADAVWVTTGDELVRVDPARVPD